MLKYCKKQHPLNIIRNPSNMLNQTNSTFNNSIKVRTTTKSNEADLGRNRNLTNNDYL